MTYPHPLPPGAAVLFSSDLPLPRTADTVSIPTSWIQDREVSVAARGLLAELAARVAPGVVATDADLSASPHPDAPTLRDLVGELLAAGYFRRLSWPGEPYYVLVHPDRLPALPTKEQP